VVDALTQEPLSGVIIHNKDSSITTFTDVYGVASLDSFDNTATIYFKSLSYLTASYNKKQLTRLNGQVALQNNGDTMDPIVISASKFEQRKQDIPQKIIFQNKEEVLFNNPQTSADLLQQSGQVFVQKSQQGGGSPMIRGFSTNRLLITVDGVRMNNAIFRGGNLQNVISIDPLSINRTEVILGPGSVVYGSDAIGGVMNFYTLEPRFATDSTYISGNALARYATANQEKTVHLDLNYGSEKFAAATSISLNSFDDLQMGAHGPDEYLRRQFVIRQDGQDMVVQNSSPRVQIPTGYNQLNLLQKFSYAPSSLWQYDLNFIYTTTSDYDRFDTLNRFRESGEPRSAQWYYGPQTWFMVNGKIKHQGDGSWYDRAVFTQSYQLFQESRNSRDFQSPDLFNNQEEVHVNISSLDFERRDESDNVLFYGAEFVHNRVNSNGNLFNIEEGTVTDAPSRYPNGSSWRSLAAYASYQWKLRNDLTIQSGLRYNHIWLDATFDDQFFDFPFTEATVNTEALTGSIGATYRPGKTWELHTNFSTAFRAPNIDDVGKIFDPSPGTVIVPNPDVEAEYSYNFEAGVKKTMVKGWTVDIAAYYTYLKDALVARDFTINGQETIMYQGELSQVQAIQNAEEAEIYGIEIGTLITLNDHLDVKAHFNYMQGNQEEEDGSKVPVRHVAPNFGDVHVIYHKNKLKLNAFVMFNGQLDFNELAPSQSDRPYLYAMDGNGNPFSPRWYTLNMRGQYAINNEVSITASLENITNQRYRTYSSGVTAAGRNLIIAMNYAF
jgi:hemoglobin/transferrin/lactoferrin receptor protein